MSASTSRFVQVTLASAALVLGTAAAIPAGAKSANALTVRAVAVHGNQVAITVANLTGRAVSGVVTTRFLAGGVAQQLRLPVTAAAGQSMTIRYVAPAPPGDVLPLGVVVDDGVPF